MAFPCGERPLRATYVSGIDVGGEERSVMSKDAARHSQCDGAGLITSRLRSELDGTIGMIKISWSVGRSVGRSIGSTPGIMSSDVTLQSRCIHVVVDNSDNQ